MLLTAEQTQIFLSLLLSERDELQTQAIAWKDIGESKCKDVEALKDQVDNLMADLHETHNNKCAVERALSFTEEKIASLNTYSDMLHNKLQEAIAHNDVCKGQLDAYADKTAELYRHLESKTEQITSLKEENERLENELEHARQEQRAEDKELAKTTGTVSTRKTKHGWGGDPSYERKADGSK